MTAVTYGPAAQIGDAAAADEGLDTRAAQALHAFCQELIEAPAGVIGADLDADRVAGWSFM